MPPSSPTIRYDKQDRVAWVTMDRPRVMNALNMEAMAAIGESFQEATSDDDVLVIVLSGAGGRAFSAGMDLKETAQRDVGGTTSVTEGPGLNALFDCPKPVVAAIDGYCLALGLELALGCDIRVATEHSHLGLPEPRRSLIPVYGIHTIPRLIPAGEAMRVLITGGHMTAQRAYEVGLIQAVVPDRGALIAEVESIAGEIKQCAPLAVQAIKRIVKVGSNLPVEYSRKLAEPIQELVDATEDRLEGPRAFAEKRAPVWKSR